MTYSEAFEAIAADPAGESSRARLYVRLNDNNGAPGTLVEITQTEAILDLPEIVRKRNESFGVVAGQSWLIKLTNANNLMGQSLKGCWALVIGGFQAADEWSGFAQGKINKVHGSTNGTVTLEIQDSVMDVLKSTLPRKIRFQSTGWVSEITVETEDENSSGWASDIPLALNSPSVAADETFKIEFFTDQAFNVYLENGDLAGTGTTAADCSISITTGETNVITIPLTGWTQGPGNYTAGDTLVFYTAKARTAAQLSPVNMVRHLLEDVFPFETYDVLAGAAYSTPLYDTDEWTDQGALAVGHEIRGTFKKGARLITLIEGALTVVQGTIRPSPTGQIALSTLQEAGGGKLTLNGDPSAGTLHIIEMDSVEDLTDTISEVTFEYLTLGSGKPASYTATAENSPLLTPKSVSYSIPWEVRGLSVDSLSNIYISRFGVARTTYTILCTLAAAVSDLSATVVIREPSLSLLNTIAAISIIAVNLLKNSVKITAFNDPFVSQIFAKVDIAKVDGPEVVR